jgi:cyclopropane-fatty-acyl-phospholipid synthase
MTEKTSNFLLKNEYPKKKNPWLKMLPAYFTDIKGGQLTLILPDGHVLKFGHANADNPQALIKLNSYKPLSVLFAKGDLAFAECYLQGEWECPDLTSLFEFGLVVETRFKINSSNNLVLKIVNRIRHVLNRNSRNGSRRNIAFHYDLGNDFYKLWLDETMTYSSALFNSPTDSLKQAQLNKYQAIGKMLNVTEMDRILEIGCGWGGFSKYIVKSKGSSIEGLTLSKEQLEFANASYKKAGIAKKAKASLTDYRDSTGEYDRIVSIEMFEAVGEDNWDTYFKTIYDRLAPWGTVVLQIITIDNERFHSYRKNADFIQRYIFPGGMLPSLEALEKAIGRNGLTIQDTHFFGTSYAQTCATWNERFQSAWPKIESSGYSPRFKRMWEYYLSYCEAGFKAGSVNVGLFKITKAT